MGDFLSLSLSGGFGRPNNGGTEHLAATVLHGVGSLEGM